MELSKRLQAVAGLVTPGNVVCDVGCDHGYVSIFLVETGKSPKVYAMDVRKGPLSRAREHVREAGLLDYIELILSDGLKEMPEEKADTLICAGMGGRLVMKILSDSMDKVRQMNELVLQPQSEIRQVRVFLREHGFEIVDEEMVEEEGKFYPILHVKIPDEAKQGKSVSKEKATVDFCLRKNIKGNESENPAKEQERLLQDKYGKVLLEKKHPVLKEYLCWEENLLSEIEKELERCTKSSEKTKKRLQTLEKDKMLIKEALSYFS